MTRRRRAARCGTRRSPASTGLRSRIADGAAQHQRLCALDVDLQHVHLALRDELVERSPRGTIDPRAADLRAGAVSGSSSIWTVPCRVRTRPPRRPRRLRRGARRSRAAARASTGPARPRPRARRACAPNTRVEADVRADVHEQRPGPEEPREQLHHVRLPDALAADPRRHVLVGRVEPERADRRVELHALRAAARRTGPPGTGVCFRIRRRKPASAGPHEAPRSPRAPAPRPPTQTARPGSYHTQPSGSGATIRTWRRTKRSRRRSPRARTRSAPSASPAGATTSS